MAEPLFLYRSQAETILALLPGAEAADEPFGEARGSLGAVVVQLDGSIRNLTDPIRLLLNAPEAAALERALQRSVPSALQPKEPWLTILARLAVLRGATPERDWHPR